MNFKKIAKSKLSNALVAFAFLAVMPANASMANGVTAKRNQNLSEAVNNKPSDWCPACQCWCKS